MIRETMRVLVFGGGSVGLGLASALVAGGARVSIVARPATVDALRERGLVRTGLFGSVTHAPHEFDAVTDVAEIDRDPFGFVLVCTKSYDTVNAAARLSDARRVVGAHTVIALCQNGLGNYETFTARFAPEQVFIGRVITGFRRPALNHVDITVHAAPVHVGSPLAPLSARAGALCETIARGGIPAEVSREIVADLWAKVLYNALLNPLGAVLGVPYGVLAQTEHGRSFMGRLARETFAVMNACGARTQWGDAGTFLEEFYARILPPTAAHESSMLQDIRAGRPTEIDAISGAIVALGQKHGVDVTCTQASYELVRMMEHRARAGVV